MTEPALKPLFDKNPKAGCALTIALIIGVGTLLVSQCTDSKQPEPDSAATTTVDEARSDLDRRAIDTQVEAEANLTADIKDPDSAKFRNEYVSQLSGGNLMLCGEVNSKNGFGAYTGFKRFVASPNPDAPNLIEGETLAADDGSDRIFADAYKVACGNPIKRLN